MKEVLERIEMRVDTVGRDELKVIPPSFRPDVTREVDLTEEIARLAGEIKSLPARAATIVFGLLKLRVMVSRNHYRHFDEFGCVRWQLTFEPEDAEDSLRFRCLF